MSPSVQALSQIIETLNADQIHEVEAFVESLRLQGEERGLASAARSSSAPSFEAVWYKPQDDAYDAL